ncbi:MAG TPA: M1 family aminopeptidase [Gemmatimonadaceae bacterium]|nr:M1 family aminopeptidase [Gemmatimonadaceae bacterium]
MTARVATVALLLVGAACVRPPQPVLEPLPVPGPVDTSVAAPPVEVDTMVSYRVPAFRPLPLVRWGPPPPGEARPPRERTYDLQHQVIRVRFDWDRLAVVGSTTLRVAGLPDRESVPAIALDAVGMTIARVTAAGAVLRHDYDGRTLTVHLPASLRPRAAATFTVEYEAASPARGAWFVPRKRVVWTQGQPENTRYWVPTFDHPGDRTTWEIIVRAPASEMALSNGRLVASRRVGREIEWHWSQAEPASTYLMSVVTGDYTVLQDTWRDKPLAYWTYADSVAAAWRGFGKTPRMTEWLAVLTAMPYPWAKYDQVVVPDYIYAGMENVTATTMADDAILHPTWAAAHAGARAENLVMHELAHQWFGNLVTARDWSHIWLNEGFARMLEMVWREEEHGADEGAWMRLLVREQALAADVRARRPLVWDRWSSDPIEAFLSGHVYARGATVLEMLRTTLGDDAFWSGVGDYLATHRLGVVETADLRAALERSSGRDLSASFAQWVDGAGYPAFRVSAAYDSLTRALALTAEQVQPRDSLTGWFSADLTVEVLTDSGVVRDVVAVRDSVARHSVLLRAAPRAIVWDGEGRVLQVVDLPRSTVMLAHQLAHTTSIPARAEAVRLLAERTTEMPAVDALARAVRADPFWGIRVQAAQALAGTALATDAAASALLDATSDFDPRVRESAAAALGQLVIEPDSSAVPVQHAGQRAARLETLIEHDTTRQVRAAAVRSLAALDRERGLRAIRAMLGRDAWTDIERRAALSTLAEIGDTVGWPLAREQLRARYHGTRVVAIAALLATGQGRAAESAVAIASLLDDQTPAVRIAAAQALARLGARTAAPALEARRARELDPRAREAIDTSLRALGAQRSPAAAR